MKPQFTWHGTQQEADALATAIANNCACEFGHMGARLVTCAAHLMLEDQRTLDGLVFARYIRERIIAQEFDLPVCPATGSGMARAG